MLYVIGLKRVGEFSLQVIPIAKVSQLREEEERVVGRVSRPVRPLLADRDFTTETRRSELRFLSVLRVSVVNLIP